MFHLVLVDIKLALAAGVVHVSDLAKHWSLLPSLVVDTAD